MIIRVKKDKDNPYVMINKDVINDDSLSWKAKGILIYLLSKHDDWQVYQIDIANHSKDGIDSIRSGIQELISQGYIIRTQERQKKGQFSQYVYQVREKPIKSTLPTETGFSHIGKPDFGKSNPTNNKETNNKSTNIYSISK